MIVRIGYPIAYAQISHSSGALVKGLVGRGKSEIDDFDGSAPIGGGFGKQLKLGRQQFQVYTQGGYNVVKPDDATGWRAITVLSLIF